LIFATKCHRVWLDFYYFMKGKFTIKPVVHGNNRFMVIGYPNGQRQREFFRTRDEAKVHCEARNIELGNHGPTLANISSALRAEALACHERLSRLGVSLSTAVDYYCAEFDVRSKSVLTEFACERCIMEFKRRLESNEISFLHYQTMLRVCRKLLVDFRGVQLCDLTPRVLKNWLIGLPVAVTTKNSLKASLSGFFTLAKQQGWIKENPCAEVEKFNDHRIKAKLPGILTPEQAAALLENAEPEILPFFAIGLFAGLRVAELERLEWSEIDFDERLIDVAAQKAKTAQGRWVPMTENLIAWLAPYRNNAHGSVVSTYGIRRRLVKQARAKAGITKWEEDDKGNALRHSFCSYHLAFHKNASLTAADAGHMNTKMLYAHYNNRVKQEAAFRYFSIAPAPEAENILAIA
jgi:integrase